MGERGDNLARVSPDEAVRAFIDAFNAEDLDALAATLTPDVEIQSSRGLVEGRDEAREWATRNPGGELTQRLVLGEMASHGAHVLASVSGSGRGATAARWPTSRSSSTWPPCARD